MSKTKYVQVGTGGRARFFYGAVASDFKDTSQLLAFCDINKARMDYSNRILEKEFNARPVKTYMSHEFDHMVRKENPDAVIVTSIDRTHHRYIVRAMELGCDVITEKPMTVDEVKCQEILDAVKKTGQNIRVTFNYRYAPHNTKLRQLIMDGTIGKINSVHFEWLLDTFHGADYFRRWHRDKRNSGGLMVHKSTHHFDLVNFWLGTRPETVFGMGDLMFYGRENAENRGITKFYSRAHNSENAKGDPFALYMEQKERLKGLYLDAESEDGYIRDQSVFGDGISIEDTMGVMVRYKNNAILTYSLNAYMPWEGFRVNFNGTKGRIEASIAEKTYVNAGGKVSDEGALSYKKILVLPIFKKPYEVEIEEKEGGHGGGDPALLNDIFGEPKEDKFKRAASHVDGAMSILTGIAANKSFKTGLPVQIDSLVNFPDK